MKLSVVIPAHNEEGCIHHTVISLCEALQAAGIEHEIIVVNDGSSDGTSAILGALEREFREVKMVVNFPPHGFGLAIRKGLAVATGDAIAVYMADASDTPKDLLRFYNRMVADSSLDCVFGTRFHPQAKLVDYPWSKLILNRLGNKLIQVLFGLNYNDITNAFKLYKRRVINGAMPLLSHHFNLTVELPLKAIVRGYSYDVLPNDWINRKTGESKLKIKEMGSRYLFIIFYCFIERWLSRGDYHKGKLVNFASECA